MKKPDSLRAALTAAIPELQKQPEQLTVFVDKGAIAARAMAGLGFEYRYRLNLLLEDFAGDDVAVFAAIMLWAARYQPELLQNYQTNNQAITFEADILDEHKVDLSIELQLSEAIVSQPRDGGGYDLVFQDEPAPEWEGTSPIGELYINGQLAVTWPPGD